MKFAEKILRLRKGKGMSQEELAEKLNVSRQAVSRWEIGSAQPDVSNILQLSKLFGVTTDYLLNDDYESDKDIPVVKNAETMANKKTKKIIALCVSSLGLLGNFIIYILSRFIEVMVPYVTYENDKKWYNWNSGLTGRSYKYFIEEYNLELLTVLFWGMFLIGIIYILLSSGKLKEAVMKYKAHRR